jgi:hypothetical protein
VIAAMDLFVVFTVSFRPRAGGLHHRYEWRDAA